jgi:signal transduction histidine kinase
MTARVAAAAAGGTAVAVGAGLIAPEPATSWLGALDWLAGAALLGGGAAALAARRRPARRGIAAADPVAVLLLVAGAAWLAGTVAPGVAVLLTLHRGPLVHAALAYPDGRLRGRAARVTAALAWVDGAVPALAASEVATLALAALVAAVAVRAAAGARGPARPARRTGAVVALLIVAAPVAGALLGLAGRAGGEAVLAAYDLSVTAAALVLARGWRPRGITDLVVELGSARGDTLRRALGDALGDPGLTVAYRAADGGHIDDAGRPVALPAPGAGRAVTQLVHAGEPIGALVHDPAVLDDPALVEDVAAAARIALENARLRARVQAQIEALAASRRRLVDAARDERRRLASQLQAGAISELEALRNAFEGLPGADASCAELTLALEDLARFAEGLAPVALPAGLRAALEDRTRRLPLAVELDVPERRFASDVETALGYVCAEALANVAKHARAGRIRIRLAEEPDALVLEVADDGVGGADPSGSGLAGVRRRVEALGGRLSVGGAIGGGTLLRAELPGAASAADPLALEALR